MPTRLTLVLGCVVLASTAMLLARQQERPALANAVRAFLSIDAPVVALTHARVIDGTGSAPSRGSNELVFKRGVGFEPARLIDSVRGHGRLW